MNFSRYTASSPKLACASARAARNARRQLGGRVDQAHALAAAARRRLQHDRISDLGGAARGGLLVRHGIGAARNHRHAGGHHAPAALDLGAHRRDRFGARTDERHAGVATERGEGGALRQEAVARVDGVGADRDRQRTISAPRR